MNNNNFFIRKSRAQQEQEAAEYEKWAFPYGAPQRAKLTELLRELFPKENEKAALVSFLTAKEIFLDLYKEPRLYEYAVKNVRKLIVRHKKFIRKVDMPVYIAMAVADSDVDENLNYPSAAELMEMAKEFPIIE